jgi:regulator of CtrA degradation
MMMVAMNDGRFETPDIGGDTVSARALGFTRSEVFRRAFKSGMGLVEETATYLDGPGREESRILPRRAALAYAGESMRLTTRLMQVASWLLVQRAVAEGEMDVAEAARDKYRLGAREVCRGRKPDAEELLPVRLVELLDLSAQLYDRIDRIDTRIYAQTDSAAGTGARAALDRLASALGSRFEG